MCWARGNFSGEPGPVHICVCEFPRCGVPGQYEYIWSLSWCGWRGGTDFFLALVLAGTVRVNRWGWRDSTDFLVPGSVLAGTVRLKFRGCAVISF